MGTVFQHADGRIMVDEGDAGGWGGGIVHRFHRLATEVEAAAFRALHAVEAEVQPPAEPAADATQPEVEPEHTDEAPAA